MKSAYFSEFTSEQEQADAAENIVVANEEEGIGAQLDRIRERVKMIERKQREQLRREMPKVNTGTANKNDKDNHHHHEDPGLP